MTWRDAAGLACLLWCAALLAWSDRPAPAAAESCRASQPVSQDEVVADFLFAPASVWKTLALERHLEVAVLRSRDVPAAHSRAR